LEMDAPIVFRIARGVFETQFDDTSVEERKVSVHVMMEGTVISRMASSAGLFEYRRTIASHEWWPGNMGRDP